MYDAVVAQLRSWLASHEAELLEEYRALLRIPSVESEPAPNAPFGLGNRQAMDFMLELARNSGMATIDLEGFCGFADFGSGKRLVATFGHLDVVPAGQGWRHDPFGAEVHGEYVYGRGAVDDKGPTMAAFYAMCAIQAVLPDLGVRFRSFFGCNEESGFRCIQRYARTEEPPEFGIAPDSGWPLVHGEKGIMNLLAQRPLIEGEMALVRVAGGERPNVVIDRCEGVVRVAPGARAGIETKLEGAWDRNLEFHWEGDELHTVAHGKAAHGGWPFGGDSAATRLFRFWREIAPTSLRRAYDQLFEATHPAGDGLGIHGSDEVSKGLTANIGIVDTVDGQVRLLVNVRYPVTWEGGRVSEAARAHLSQLDSRWTVTETRDSKPLYFPLEHPLVRTICDVYEAETGERKEPGVMGGGTYARAIANTVSIGTGWDGDGDAHEAGERLKIAHLFKMSRIYAHILYRLATL
jgi:succinyl-diaminopimelate desuccinylase